MFGACRALRVLVIARYVCVKLWGDLSLQWVCILSVCWGYKFRQDHMWKQTLKWEEWKFEHWRRQILEAHLIYTILGFRQWEHTLLTLITAGNLPWESLPFSFLAFACLSVLVLNVTLALLEFNLYYFRERCNLQFFDSECYKIP